MFISQSSTALPDAKTDSLFEPLNQLTIHRTRASFRKISQQTGQPTKAAPAKWQPQFGFVGEAAQRQKTLLRGWTTRFERLPADRSVPLVADEIRKRRYHLPPEAQAKIAWIREQKHSVEATACSSSATHNVTPMFSAPASCHVPSAPQIPSG